METRTLGKTGLAVSALGFGGSPLGGVFRPIDEAEGIATVHAALDSGVNLFDVAPFYGLTQAETVLGRALRGIPRSRYLLSTKVGRYGADAFDFSPERVTRSVDESLHRLGLDYADILLCHDIEFGDLTQIVKETIPAMRAIQAAGKARFIGVSGLPLPIFIHVLDRVELDVILSYCHYHLADTSLEPLLSYLEEKGVGVINASPLAMGLLTDDPVPDWHPAPPELKAACARAAAHCRERGASIARLAVQFAVSNPRLPVTLVGMATREELHANRDALAAPLDRELLAEAQAILAPVRNTTWPSGRPENN